MQSGQSTLSALPAIPSPGGPTALATTPGRRAWREIEVLALVVLVLGVYFSRLTDLTIRGEESRWARVAQEMIDSGDWIVPRQQGAPFLDRPPLNSWAMILASKFTGGVNLAAIRLPAAMATLLTTLLIYFYGRSFLSRVGALAAAVAYPTMAQVLQLGRLAESDALLTLCMSAALFAWHFAYARRRDPRLAWTAGYALAALAALAKGPQGPVYFVGITTVFLAVRRDWRFLFNRWQLAGWAAFACVLGAWHLPLMLEIDPAKVTAIWSEGGMVGQRFQYHSLRYALGRWAAYPFDVLACTMPWSCLLFALPTRWFRGSLGEARPLFAFLVTACAVTFPTCWLPIDSRARYFMSLYPCLALLAGMVVERCCQSPRASWWQRSWDRYVTVGLAMIVGAGLIVPTAWLWGGSILFGMGESMSGAFAIAYCLAAAAAASVVAWSRLRPTLPRVQLGILTLAGFMGLSYTGIVISMQARTSNDPSLAVLSVRDLIPPGERLLSFGPVHHLFAYYYQEPIELRKVSGGQAPTEFSNTYFCFVDDPFFETPEIPFAWNRVAEISCERFRSRHPLTKVVIGTRRGVATLSQARTATALVPSDQPRAVRTADYEEPIPPKQ